MITFLRMVIDADQGVMDNQSKRLSIVTDQEWVIFGVYPPPLEARQLAFGQLAPEPSCVGLFFFFNHINDQKASYLSFKDNIWLIVSCEKK